VVGRHRLGVSFIAECSAEKWTTVSPWQAAVLTLCGGFGALYAVTLAAAVASGAVPEAGAYTRTLLSST